MATSLGEHIKRQLTGLVGFAAMEEGIRRTIEWGEAVYDTAVKLGLTIEAEQRWDFALKLAGTSLQENIKFFQMLSVARDKAARGVAKPEQMHAFQTFGITDEQIKDKNIDLASIMAAKAKDMDQDKLMAAMRALGGKSAGNLVEAFRIGLSDLLAEAPVVGDKAIIELKEAADRMKSLFAEIRAGLAPLVAWLTTILPDAFHGLSMLVEGIMGTMFEMGRQTAEIAAHPLKFISEIQKTGKLPEGFGMGAALKAGKEQAEDYGRSIIESEKKRRDALEQAKRFHGGMGEADDDEKSKKDLAADKKHQAEKLKLIAEEEKIRAESYLKSLKPQEKVSELERALKAMRAREKGEWTAGVLGFEDENVSLKTKVDIANLEKELAAARKEADKPAHGHAQHQVNALQRIGAFAANPLEHMALSIHQKSENHLREMRKDIKKLVDRGVGTEGASYA